MKERVMTELVPLLAVGSGNDIKDGVGCLLDIKCWMQGGNGVWTSAQGFSSPIKWRLIGANDNICTHTTRHPTLNTRLNCAECSLFLFDAMAALDDSDWLPTDSQSVTDCEQDQLDRLLGMSGYNRGWWCTTQPLAMWHRHGITELVEKYTAYAALHKPVTEPVPQRHTVSEAVTRLGLTTKERAHV